MARQKLVNREPLHPLHRRRSRRKRTVRVRFHGEVLGGHEAIRRGKSCFSRWQNLVASKDIDKDGRTVRDELKLNRADVGWYQIRNALKKRNESGDTVPVDFSAFEAAYQILGDKLRPQVYELGFLRV